MRPSVLMIWKLLNIAIDWVKGRSSSSRNHMEGRLNVQSGHDKLYIKKKKKNEWVMLLWSSELKIETREAEGSIRSLRRENLIDMIIMMIFLRTLYFSGVYDNCFFFLKWVHFKLELIIPRILTLVLWKGHRLRLRSDSSERSKMSSVPRPQWGHCKRCISSTPNWRLTGCSKRRKILPYHRFK